MTTTEPAPPAAPTGEQFGVLTDAGIERSRKRLGVPQPQHNPPHNFEVTWDGSRHFAYGYGDDNPLYCDPEYATATIWGGPIAPPPLVGGDSLIGEDEVTAVPDDKRELMKGDPLRGVHAFYSASARESRVRSRASASYRGRAARRSRSA